MVRQRLVSSLIASVTILVCTITATAQPPVATQQHQWLQKFVGQWDTKSTAQAGPGQPAIECVGTIDSKMLGEFWVVNHVTGEMQGTTVKALQTIGFDVDSGKYVGTWIDNVSAYQWRSEGTVDPAGKTLTLISEGPNYLEPGKVAKFRDMYEFKTPDHIVAISEIEGPDGKWIRYVTGDFKRKQ